MAELDPLSQNIAEYLAVSPNVYPLREFAEQCDPTSVSETEELARIVSLSVHTVTHAVDGKLNLETLVPYWALEGVDWVGIARYLIAHAAAVDPAVTFALGVAQNMRQRGLTEVASHLERAAAYLVGGQPKEEPVEDEGPTTGCQTCGT